MPVHQSHTVQAGTTQHSVFVLAREPGGVPVTGLEAADVVAGFVRTLGDAVAVVVQPGGAGSWTPGGFREVDADALPGVYEFGVPDEVLEAGATEAVLQIRADGAQIAPVKFNLVAYDPQDAWSLGMTQLQDYKRHQVLRRALPRFTEMELELGLQGEQHLADRLGEQPPSWATEG